MGQGQNIVLIEFIIRVINFEVFLMKLELLMERLQVQHRFLRRNLLQYLEYGQLLMQVRKVQ